jgi:hypothetical protein
MINPFEYLAFRLLRLSRRLHLSRLLWSATSTQQFITFFKGFENVKAVKSIFGEKTEAVLRNLKVEFILFGYMGVDSTDGHLLVNRRYLKNGNRTDIYLDVVHELCHVKQWMNGKELFDYNYEYVDRPTEIEAYRFTVLEARRIGLTDEQILDYLKTEWMSNGEVKRLVKNMGLDFQDASLPSKS